MIKTLKEYKFSVTIGTITVCVITLLTFGFNIGKEKAEIINQVKINKSEICKLQERHKKSDSFELNFTTSLAEMKSDIKHIKETIDKL